MAIDEEKVAYWGPVFYDAETENIYGLVDNQLYFTRLDLIGDSMTFSVKASDWQPIEPDWNPDFKRRVYAVLTAAQVAFEQNLGNESDFGG